MRFIWRWRYPLVQGRWRLSTRDCGPPPRPSVSRPIRREPGVESLQHARRRSPAMSVTTRPIGTCFAAEAHGVDLTKPLSDEDVGGIHAGMDRYAVLVFHEQPLDDEQQLAFTRSLGEIEHAIG